MKFLHVGNAYQLSIKDGRDLADALVLDEALWVAMSAPVKAYTCDPKALAYIDTAKLGSITTESLKSAIRWLLDVYRNREEITDHFDGRLCLASLTDSENASKIRHSAEYILKDLGEKETGAITLAQVRQFQKILTGRPLNGDGVISLLAAGEASSPDLQEKLRQIIQDGVLVEKKALKTPQKLVNVVKCQNPRCITSTEQELDHVFVLTEPETGAYRCIYCEAQAQ